MAAHPDSIDKMVISLIPSLSRSLAEQFNVFRVMHHGTHEKQLSNVFAWLLNPDATHELGHTFLRISIDKVTEQRPNVAPLPASGYRSDRRPTLPIATTLRTSLTSLSLGPKPRS